MQLCSDYALVNKFIRGDEKAFAEIISRYHHSLWWTARKTVFTDFDAQDILQEAYLSAALNIHHFRADASLKTWLHRLVLNASHDFRRSRYRIDETVIFDDEDADIPHLTYDPLSAMDLTLTLVSVLGKLNERQRLILIMVDVLGYTIYHTAADLGISAGTVKSRRSRAKHIIRSRHPELVGM
ncbi:sigma-70 family RNA polymerase sigma factor [Corynebacterium sp. H130]|uniref:sigma-70 family RNA polymerase sigma factor n=1 Tax=Corynebacterium sp. H130 TaxID=3133444 RepID=UPI00309EE9E5